MAGLFRGFYLLLQRTLVFYFFLKGGAYLQTLNSTKDEKKEGNGMDLFCLDIKKKEVSKTSCWCWCWCWCCSLWKKNDDDATEGAKKERRNRNREETGTRKRRRTRPSRGRVGGVFSREERKGFALLFFIFSSSPNFPSLLFLLNAHCVLLRETIARTLPLWEEHRRRRRRWVPGGGRR